MSYSTTLNSELFGVFLFDFLIKYAPSPNVVIQQKKQHIAQQTINKNIIVSIKGSNLLLHNSLT